MFYVFVYGTLKKGEPNHSWFSKNQSGSYKFICNAETTEKYPLIVTTKYNVPFFLYKPGIGKYVKGEVYEVDEKTLEDLDALEEHPTFYVREEYLVKRLDNGETMTVWIYTIKQFRNDLLDLPHLECYSNADQENTGSIYVLRDESKLTDLL